MTMEMTGGRMMVRWCAILSGLVAMSLTGVLAADQPLADAARRADWGVVRALVEQGADVTVRQGDGATALHWAAYWDQVELADLLIGVGADVNAANDLGVTPLWAAAENRSAAMVERLLDAGGEPGRGAAFRGDAADDRGPGRRGGRRPATARGGGPIRR